MAKRATPKAAKTNGRTTAEQARLDEKRRLQREVRAERELTKLATTMRKCVFQRDAAIAEMLEVLGRRQHVLTGQALTERPS